MTHRRFASTEAGYLKVVALEPVVARFPPQRASVAAARQFVTNELIAAGVTSVLDEARLLTSELATNAVVHAATEFTVSVRVVASRVYVEVRDGDPFGQVSQRIATSTLPLGGQGLRIVGRIARSWGTRVEDQSKVVWFSVDVRALRPRFGPGWWG